MDTDFDRDGTWTDHHPADLRLRGYPETLIALITAQCRAIDDLLIQTTDPGDAQIRALVRGETHIQLYLQHLKGRGCSRSGATHDAGEASEPAFACLDGEQACGMATDCHCRSLAQSQVVQRLPEFRHTMAHERRIDT